MSATPFAKLKNAPILLTQSNKLNEDTKKEIERLDAKNVYIIGGEEAISNEVILQLKSMNINIERISGKDRYETSLKIANKLGKISEIAVVNGEHGLVDAVSISPVAASKNMAIILSSSSNGIKLFEKFIEENDIKTTYVIGNEKSLSNEVTDKLPGVKRLGGENRNETNAAILETFYDENIKNIFVAKNGIKSEDELVDALAVGVVAAKENSPVVVVSDQLNSKQAQLISSKSLKEITKVGGNGNENAFNQIANIFRK
ncbi:N-acetylmuramoyl-L-alanine amidase LytC [bioreactor metagenome]|uniref:N-acetylmuramoyl-L-alanine amidase LytC n=2 Tax=root TaxID=1 RepID=A0A644YY78_9ZZZZ